VLKQGSKTHSSRRQSNLQLHNEAALMSCRIRAVEHRKCATTGWRTPRLARSNLAKPHKNWKCAQSTQENFRFLLFAMYIEDQQTFIFPFSLLRHYQMPECFYFNNCCFWASAI